MIAVETNCLNCCAPLHGAYCAACGQKASLHRLGFHDFAHEATHEFLHVDEKILRTLKLLFLRPGELTREFVAGRRARYVSPLRLYLIASAVFFSVVALYGDKIGAVKVSRGSSVNAEASHRVAEMLAHTIPKAMFVLMPLSALILWALYRRAQPYYIAHLYFAIHLHAFTFLVLSAASLIVHFAATKFSPLTWLASAVAAWPFVYLFLAQRRFYAEAWPRIVLKSIVSIAAYYCLLAGFVIAFLKLALHNL